LVALSQVFVAPSPRAVPNSGHLLAARGQGQGTLSGVTTHAKGGGAAALEAETEADDSVEIYGFSGFVVGLALMPHILYALVCAYGVAVKGEEFALGPYGMELISCTVAVGVVMWSFGSFVQRGRGLPAGPLGLFGLAEGLSYLAALALIGAGGATYFRTPSGTGLKSSISMPSVPSLPAVKAPEFKAPDIKVPSFKAPEIKMPEIKAPEIKVPDVKVPEVKLPEVPKPAAKPAPEPEKPKPVPKPVPEAEKPTPAPKPAPEPAKPKPAPEAKASAPKKDSAPDFDSLFD